MQDQKLSSKIGWLALGAKASSSKLA